MQLAYISRHKEYNRNITDPQSMPLHPAEQETGKMPRRNWQIELPSPQFSRQFGDLISKSPITNDRIY